MSVLVYLDNPIENGPFEFDCIPRIGEYIQPKETSYAIVRISKIVHTPWDNTYDATIYCERE